MESLDRALTEYRLRTVNIGVRATLLVLVALLLYVLVPGDDELHRGAMLTLMGVAFLGAVVVWRLPWRRLFERGQGLTLMYVWSVLDIVVISSLIAYAGHSHMEVFFLYAFTTMFAASYPFRGQVVLLAFTAACYVGTMAVQGWPVEAPDMVARLGLLAVLAWMSGFLSSQLIAGLRASAEAGAESDHRARLLASVADAARSMSAHDTDLILEHVVHGAARMDFETSSLVLLDRDTSTFRVGFALGLAEEHASLEYPSDQGVAGMVLERGTIVVMDDYRAHPKALPALAAEGFLAVIAAPVQVGDEIEAVLVAATRSRRGVTVQETEAMELLAAVAGRALENAGALEQERSANERLAELDRLKSDFLSNVSHELRTPLTAIKGVGGTLEELWDQITDADRRDLLSRLNANATSLHQIITTLLDFSQLEAGRLPFERQDVDVVNLLSGLTGRLESVLSTHRVEVDTPARLAVHADAILLDRVLENLLSNAIQHTSPGTLVVVGAAERDGEAFLSVTDHGPGIPEAELPHVLERFYRGGDPNTRDTRGTGLGLALVEEILRLHDTELSIESQVDRGSRFSFRLPLAVREQADAVS